MEPEREYDGMKLGKLRYYAGLFLGSISGTNSIEMAREAILWDIKRAKKTIRVVSCTADMSYWTQEILDELKMKKTRMPQIDIEFLVGPELSNGPLEKLSKEGAVSLYRLTERPPCDCRIIDNLGTYTSNHRDSGNQRKCLWTFRNVRAAKDRLEYYDDLKKKAA